MILKEVRKFKIDTFRDNRGLLSFFLLQRIDLILKEFITLKITM